MQVENFERRLRAAEGHIEAGRLLAFYQVFIFSSCRINLHPSDIEGDLAVLLLV